MFFKLILIGTLGYFLMRMVFKPQTLKENHQDKIQKKESPTHDDYIDYEEID